VWKDQPYDNKSDVWSLGCVLYEVTALQPPFRANDMDGLFKKVLKGIYPRIPNHYSDELNKMLKRLISVNPNQRPTCDQIFQLDIVKRYMAKLNIQLLEEDLQDL
jgi:NIMA (never in mitosis gene a)-related kinase